MTVHASRVEVVDEDVTDRAEVEDAPSEYRLSLQRAARAGIVEVSSTSLGLSGAGVPSRRLRKVQKEGQVQMASIVGQRIKADIAYEAVASSAQVAAETYSDAAAAISAAKQNSGDHEYVDLVGDVCDHLVHAAGQEIVKTQAAAAKNMGRAVARDLYKEADERSLVDRVLNR